MGHFLKKLQVHAHFDCPEITKEVYVAGLFVQQIVIFCFSLLHRMNLYTYCKLLAMKNCWSVLSVRIDFTERQFKIKF